MVRVVWLLASNLPAGCRRRHTPDQKEGNRRNRAGAFQKFDSGVRRGCCIAIWPG